MAVSAERKASMIQMEFASGFMMALQNEKAFVRESCSYKDQYYSCYKGSEDSESTAKVAAVKEAIEVVVDHGFKLPSDLRFYCIHQAGTKQVTNQAYTRDPAWTAINYVTLGPSTLSGGALDAISNTSHPGFSKGTVTCLHELGHIFHAVKMGENFLATNAEGGVTGAPTGANAVQVSGYAGKAKKEFVAEVFAGMMIGRKYLETVMTEYKLYNGPST